MAVQGLWMFSEDFEERVTAEFVKDSDGKEYYIKKCAAEVVFVRGIIHDAMNTGYKTRLHRNCKQMGL